MRCCLPSMCLLTASCRAQDGAAVRLLWATAAWRAADRLRAYDPELHQALLEEALDQLALMGEAEQRSPEASLRRADILRDLGREQEAWRVFADAQQRDPRAAAVQRDWAKALARSGRDREAVAKLEEAVRYAPDDAWLRFELGAAYRRAAREEHAIAALRRATQLDARLHCAFAEWGRALESLGRVEAARRRFAQAARLRGDQPDCRWPAP